MTSVDQPFDASWQTITIWALLLVAACYVIADLGARVVLSKDASPKDKITFIWLAFDGLIHACVELPFIICSTGGRTVNTSTGILAAMWRDYARADARWGTADPTIVSIELLTVFFCGPLCFYILYLMTQRNPSRHFWLVVLCSAELYGVWMTFAPDFLQGAVNLVLHPKAILLFWIYNLGMNALWVVFPVYLLFASYGEISKSLRLTHAKQTAAKSR